jgi:hypothetical protein
MLEQQVERTSSDDRAGRLASKNDPRNPWTGANLLQTFIDLNNKSVNSEVQA